MKFPDVLTVRTVTHFMMHANPDLVSSYHKLMSGASELFVFCMADVPISISLNA